MIRPQDSWLILTTWRRRTRRWAAWGRSRSPPSSWPVSSPSCCRRRWAEAQWSARLRSATASRRPCWSGSAWVQQRQQSLVHKFTTCWLYTEFWFLLLCIYWTHNFLFTYSRTGQSRTFTILILFFILSLYILCVQFFGQFVWSWSRALTVTTIKHILVFYIRLVGRLSNPHHHTRSTDWLLIHIPQFSAEKLISCQRPDSWNKIQLQI